MRFRYAICNELFEGVTHAEVCRIAAELGYTGLEITPFTLAPRIEQVTPEQRRQIKEAANEHGLQIIGLHWLLAKTEGFHVNSAEEKTRIRTAQYLEELAQCCSDLGGDFMVFGSPAQRRIPDGASREQALAWAADTFRRAASVFADFGVRLCLEPLSTSETNFINTLEEAEELVKRIDHPNFCLHFDVKAMSTETNSIPELIHRFANRVGHFHANDVNRRGPGNGPTDFVPILQALEKSAYHGWISVEVFDFTPDPITIARESIAYLRRSESHVL